MHSAEVTALAAALVMPPPAVVAAAGGTILDPGARSEIAAAGLLVWLRITVETVEERSAGETIGPGPMTTVPAGSHAQWPSGKAYAEVADLILDADTVAPATLADRIMDVFEHERPRRSLVRGGPPP